MKPEHVSEFLEVVRHDAEHSEKDEPGCLRFDVIQDRDDPNRFYFYEIYRDEAALEAHRQTPHFKLYAEKSKPSGRPSRASLRQESDSFRRRLALTLALPIRLQLRSRIVVL